MFLLFLALFQIDVPVQPSKGITSVKRGCSVETTKIERIKNEGLTTQGNTGQFHKLTMECASVRFVSDELKLIARCLRSPVGKSKQLRLHFDCLQKAERW